MPEFIYHCPHCGQKYECDESWIGAQIRCQACRRKSVVMMHGKAAKKLRWKIPAVTIMAVVFVWLFLYTILLNDRKADIDFPRFDLKDKITRDQAYFYKLWKNKDNKNNQAETLFLLGKCFDNGTGVKASNQDALKYYKKASELGSAKADHNMGCIYLSWQKYENVTDYFKKGIEHNIPQSYYMLGQCYYNGYGVSKDNRKSFELIKKSADMNFSDAQYTVGFFYKYGIGVEDNEDKALEYLHLAAKNNHIEAKKMIARLQKENPSTNISHQGRKTSQKSITRYDVIYNTKKALNLAQQVSGETATRFHADHVLIGTDKATCHFSCYVNGRKHIGGMEFRISGNRLIPTGQCYLDPD